ncbi:LysE family transporter [Salinicola sp. RZ23]|uniref:LysE/ArgO family amino acid transporter n=1 Tax=Salinicola sp. RZ23 TaxID=1949087 RepID=UPI001E34123B|nr:LysE family transporter [Salinicola sp. RZ23]
MNLSLDSGMLASAPLLVSLLQGLVIGAGLIVAIGAQNAFVLRQGLRREYALRVAAICALCDLALIAVGVAGFAPLLASRPLLMQLARWGGVVWLCWQAWLALGRARCPQALAPAAGGGASARRVVLATLGVTLLNPHVYLDTLVMLGLIGSQQASPPAFVAGAALASLIWFFGLVGLAQWLAPRLRDPRWWCGIELGVALVMLWVALHLALG